MICLHTHNTGKNLKIAVSPKPKNAQEWVTATLRLKEMLYFGVLLLVTNPRYNISSYKLSEKVRSKRHSSSPKPKKFRTKVMFRLFWTIKVRYWNTICKEGQMATANRTVTCCRIIWNSQQCRNITVAQVWWLLQHENARTHTSCMTEEKLSNLRLKCLPFSPVPALPHFHRASHRAITMCSDSSKRNFVPLKSKTTKR